MIPSAFVLLEKLPLTGGGKVDRRALPAPEAARPQLETAYVAPRTSVEERIAAVWKEMLGRERIGVHDNFFEVGGNSLLLVQIHSRLRESLNREITMVQLFRHPTVQSLARFLEGEGRETKPAAEPAERARRAAAVRQGGGAEAAGAMDRQKQFLEEQRKRREAGRRPLRGPR
jgi:acyl carrier protein